MIRVAIVGCGIIGRNHAAAILRHPRLTISTVVDPVAEARDRMAAQVSGHTGGPPPVAHATLAAALAEAVDLVAICTPSGLHGGAAEQVVTAGRHLAIEKPVEVSLPRARRLARLAAEAESRGLVCSVISQHRFDPASAAVKLAVVDGRLGRLTSAVATVPWWRGQDYYDSAQWRGTWAFDGGGAVLNQGVHTVDLLVWLLGRPQDVFAYTARLAHERIEVEDVAVAAIRFGSGALAALHATTGAYPGLPARIAVHGSLGSAVIHDDQLEFFGAGPDGAAAAVPAGERYGAAKPEDGFVLGHLRQYADIVAAIEAGRPASIGVHDGLVALAVVRAIYLSATLGRPIPIDHVLQGGYDQVPVTV
ncbi:MAG TPA: Gfo/Idh/MocA family oxidoreductase [Actinophytocola sp.]|uniref:Gfo/Idh/MocA family protein n=1 Tax=Actinophytocola sp. TaxID=1872138 RepID=UPI002DBCD4C5|nr:Gfo/Idh/MocA family oxidoreductase [Actinophytocola sp.]HEU5471012.1 Gfo/Idh/MocA family oxidoreductase [Actinophytocola sp.]